MSQLKVNTIRHTGASSDAVTLATDGTCTAKITNRSSNLIVNGSCIVAQRGTSSTSGNYQTVDRFYPDWNGTDEAMTQSQVDVTSGTEPFTLGFRKALKLQNGNQTSGAGAADDGYILYRLEAQDIANCGWDYTSTSSYITYSFWVKSSVAQTFYGVWTTHDGTSKAYPISFALSADTWTKVTGSIPGVSGLQFDNNNMHGLDLRIYTFLGTDKTASGVSLNTWANTNWSERTPDYTSTWWTTNDATFELTGVQLTATDYCPDFPFESYGQTLAKCQRYFWKSFPDGVAPAKNLGNTDSIFSQVVTGYNGSVIIPISMRTDPTLVFYNPSADNSNNSSSGATATNRSTSNGIFVEWGSVAGNFYTQITASAEL